MNNILRQKVKENRNRRMREAFLASVRERFSSFLSAAPYSSDSAHLAFAAYPTWDTQNDRQTTTRGDLDNMAIRAFDDWESLIKHISSLEKNNTLSGWFYLVEEDGPYYAMRQADFLQYIDDIADYCQRHELYDIAWIGSDTDTGIVVEYNETPTGKGAFELCTWGDPSPGAP